MTAFDITPFSPVHLGGCVPDGERNCEAWGIEAALEAYRDARAGEANVAPERIAIVAGTTEGESGAITGLATAIARALGARGPTWTISTACSSSANAIGLGCDLIGRGDADLVIAGGAERLVPEMYAGFFRLGVLAVEKCAPFGETRGTNLGEGAGFVVLERDGARTGKRWAYVNGYGLSSDAWHETSPEPRGEGIARAIRSCLDDAGLRASDIDYVNAHATGTAANDDAEWRGIKSVLAERADRVPVSGTKSFLGHAQGAAGALETIATLVSMDEDTIPPTLRVGRGRPSGPPDPVSQPAPRPHPVRHALSNSSAFAGANAVVCIGREASVPSVDRRIVRMIGIGVAREESDLTLDVDLRNTDPSARLSLAASARAIADAGLRVRGELRNRIGIFGGATRISPASADEYRASIERGGLAGASAPAFARLVLHAPIGAVSRLLALRGPTTTLADDRMAGLLAVAYAADWLENRNDCDFLVACAFDERTGDERAQGAASVVLSALHSDGPRVAGVASAGPGRIEEAIEIALGRAEIVRSNVEVFVGASGEAPSLHSMLLSIDACRAVREGGRAAVTAADGPSGSCALVLAV